VREGGREGGREKVGKNHTHLAVCERDIFDALLLGKLETAHLVMCVCVCVCVCVCARANVCVCTNIERESIVDCSPAPKRWKRRE
jgi:hypothetical protein